MSLLGKFRNLTKARRKIKKKKDVNGFVVLTSGILVHAMHTDTHTYVA